MQILKQYVMVSGQHNNFAQSPIQFCHTVEDPMKTELKKLLGISNLGGMGSYLGITESRGGAKNKSFQFCEGTSPISDKQLDPKVLIKGRKGSPY